MPEWISKGELVVGGLKALWETIVFGLIGLAVVMTFSHDRALERIEKKLDEKPPTVIPTVTPCPLAHYPVIQMKDYWQQDMITTMPFDLMTTFTMTPCDGGTR
jgi:hypothetical protein